ADQRHARVGHLPLRGAGQPDAALLARKPGPREHQPGELASRGGRHAMNAPEKFLAGSVVQPATGTSHPHDSARAHVAGAATYVDDIAEVRGTLHAAPILSNVARGKLLGVDTTEAIKMPGVKGVVLAQDVPGDRILATFTHDEPIFALDTVEFVGQVIGIVVAETVMQARRAARKVKLKIEPLPAILDVREAVKAQSF